MIDIIGHVSWVDLIGVLGVVFYTSNFTMVSLGRRHSDSLIFFAMSGLGATCILISLTQDFNLSSAMIQIFYLVLSAIGLLVRIWRVLRVRGYVGSHRPTPYS